MRACIVVFAIISALSITEGRRKKPQNLVVYELKDSENGQNPEVNVAKVPIDVLLKSINSGPEPLLVQEQSQGKEAEKGYDMKKLLGTLLGNKPKPSNKKARKKNLIHTLKTLVKQLEKEHDIDELLENSEKDDLEYKDDEGTRYYLIPKEKQQKTDLASAVPLDALLRGLDRDDGYNRDDEDNDRNAWDDRYDHFYRQ